MMLERILAQRPAKVTYPTMVKSLKQKIETGLSLDPGIDHWLEITTTVTDKQVLHWVCQHIVEMSAQIAKPCPPHIIAMAKDAWNSVDNHALSPYATSLELLDYIN